MGGGRTTAHLLKLTNNYTGVDYVQKYAEETAKRFPSANILWADATNLSEFKASTFDFVLFSYNGLDSISHADRLKVLGEVNRVLRKGGIFMFSSHNRDYEHFRKLPWQRRFHFSKKYLIFFLHCMYYLPNHYRMRKHEVFTDDYAIINDGDHRYSLMLYYIGIPEQAAQLERHGFSEIEAYDTAGQRVDADQSSHWIHYLSVKV